MLIIEHSPETILPNHDLFCEDIPVNGYRTHKYPVGLLQTSVIRFIKYFIETDMNEAKTILSWLLENNVCLNWESD